MIRYKFLRLVLDDEGNEIIVSDFDLSKWEIGVMRHVDGPIILCKNGLHCSEYIHQARRYVAGDVLAEVEAGGYCSPSSMFEGDKEAWENMTILRAWRWSDEDEDAWNDVRYFFATNADAQAWFLHHLEGKPLMGVTYDQTSNDIPPNTHYE